ncbi:site-specific integrase [Mesorhizobium sp. M2D.F.Ca.ET.223.01.1.1]|uniref:tyrosine-type recombinase/integrase n=1 Tax=unclassified Mesorhizobium TaxID=325217 RepID=UPI000FCBF1C4|nr:MULTISPECIES: site-specific integrase [unclassified Mesorhizobium]TGP89375.1 site-specific integrase [bacterium M00.F.Ca.ET.221.01.1.1]TGP94747.1 site-specific integrase [bacterium M00.F.Ca.ET.222.01.1.1]RVD58838.1 site-specific integrase [Mesorhizobium sp. M2D.F.Ca.ET.140.01.1.1]TGP27867.1 site-specific integrase [Mesorhizobium sp. M2D.F.Ca.ET.232.01.1.1]TGP75916.1 site-specific integrase [Mesorhizobium sp. M2D.F.Ca.ET.224.01.1.1]
MARGVKRLFQIGDHWLDRRDDRPGWYRFSYDPTTRQTRKFSMETDNFEEAKAKLEDWYMEQRLRSGRDLRSEDVTLRDLFKEYEANHVHKLRSRQAVSILLRYWLDFWKDATVADVRSIPRQEEFVAWLFAKGLANNSVNRGLEVGRGAINRAWRRGVIRDKPFIQMLTVETDRPMGRPLDVAEIRKLYTHSADHIRLFLVLMLATGARNEAITSLTWPQIDFENNLVLLNPKGRKQTSKRRPTVRLVPFLREVLEPMDKTTPAVVMFRGQKVVHINKGIRAALRRADMDREVTAYSCRHTVARWLRKEGVPPWETAMQLGHKVTGFSMTERYASWSPDYLEKSSAAIEKLLRAAIPLDAPPVPNGR